MIDFEKIVEQLLTEDLMILGELDSGNPVNDDSKEKTPEELEEEVITNLAGYIKVEYYNILQSAFSKTFANYYKSGAGVFPDIATLEKLIYVVSKNSIRDTENIGSFDNDLASLFPLIDLIALGKQAYTETKGKLEDKQKAFDAVYDSFAKRLDGFERAKKQMPLEFPAISPWASNVRARYFEKQGKLDIGKLKLDNLELQDKSIREAIMVLLEHRRKSKIKLFKKEIAIGNAANEINNILENPNNYIQGKISFPDQKINLLYHGATPDLILSVAKSALSLFEQQVKERNLSKEEITSDLYSKFLDNDVKKTFDYKWRQVSKNIDASKKARQSSNYRESLENKFDRLLEQETNEMSNQTFAEGSYKIKDIKNNGSVPQANQLYKSLKTLADYIQTEAARIDWSQKISDAASAGSDMAQGARLGAQLLK